MLLNDFFKGSILTKDKKVHALVKYIKDCPFNIIFYNK